MVKPGPSAYLFIGEDEYLKEKAIKDLASSVLGGSSKDLDCKTFYGGEAEANEVIDQLNTIPFLASKRLVIVRDLDKASQELKSRIADYVKKPSKATCLILESSDDSVLGDYAGLAGGVSVRNVGPLTSGETASWIKKFMSQRRKTIEPEAVSILQEAHGHNLMMLEQELEKLAAFTGERPMARLSDAEEIIGKSLISSTFAVADAIGMRRQEEALRICHDLIGSGKREYEIVGLLSWHFRRLLKAKTFRSRGESDNRIAMSLKIGRKHCATFFGQVSGLSLEGIKSGMRILLEADLDIKRTRLDPALVLELAIVRLCL